MGKAYDQQTETIIFAISSLASQNPDIEVVWLYGSRARGNAHKESDYDLAIAFKNFQLSDFDKYIRPNELALEWSERLNIGSEKLSIVDINQAPIYLAYNIVEHGSIIFQGQTSRAFREQDRIYSMYEYQTREAMNEK